MKKILLILFLFLNLSGLSIAESIVFEGAPHKRNSSFASQDSFDKSMTGEEKTIYKLIITKDDQNYIWFTRDKKRLLHYHSGIYDLFVNPEGSGYIKITKTEDGKYLYFEHMSLGLDTITYWGFGNNLEL